MLNPCGVEVRSTVEGHLAGGRADYHDLGVFWEPNPVLELIALSGRSISRQNALASSRRQVNYATDWPVNCIIQLVGWGVAFLWPGPSTRDPPGQPASSHLDAPAGQPDGRKNLVSHLEFACLVLRGGSGGSTALIAQEQRSKKKL